jgi:hypothetical protein
MPFNIYVALALRTRPLSAKRAGRTLRRRAVEVDLGRIERLRADGLGLRSTAAMPGISVNTLQKHALKAETGQLDVQNQGFCAGIVVPDPWEQRRAMSLWPGQTITLTALIRVAERGPPGATACVPATCQAYLGTTLLAAELHSGNRG